LYGISFIDANTGTIVGENGTILRTTNSGTNWISQTSGTTLILSSVFFTNANTGAAVGENGTILRTTNGGTNWLSQISGTTVWLNGIFLTDTNNGTAVGGLYSFISTILNTTNGGTNWISQLSNTTNSLYGISFTDANNATVVGRNGTILRTTNCGVTFANQINSEIPEGFSLYQNYPNPFNPLTNIRFDIPKSNHVKIIIYNALGKEITTLVNEKLSAGSYEVNWNASGYPSGVYFYRLLTEEFADTRKMVLLK
jgi:hypothetical protein